MPIRLRLTLWYAGLLAAILAVFGAGVYLTLRQSLYHNLDETIEARASGVLSSLRFDEGQPVLPDGSLITADGDDGFVRIVGPSDDSLHASGELRVRTYDVVHEGEVVGRLLVGQSQEDVSEALRTLLLISVAAYVASLVVAVLTGVFLAGRALSPVDKVTGMARQISAENLEQRLNLQLPEDEVGRLARTFDEMIGRLDAAFRRQRQFTADASHELRTPLTVMKGQVEVALQIDRSGVEYRDVLESVNSEVDRLIGLAGSLLTLARADAGEIPLSLEPVDLGEAVSGTVEHMKPAAAEKDIGIEVTAGPKTTVQVDETLFLQLMLDLLDNAVKYTPQGGRISVGWDRSAQVELWIKDTGIGISEQHIPHIMDRFYRADDSRGRSEGGVGLGLAIGRWIAEAHGGSLRVESTPDEGSTFTVALPFAG